MCWQRWETGAPCTLGYCVGGAPERTGCINSISRRGRLSFATPLLQAGQKELRGARLPSAGSRKAEKAVAEESNASKTDRVHSGEPSGCMAD